MNRSPVLAVLAALAAVLLLAAPAAAQTPTPTPTPVVTPSVVQLCAATGVEQVDALLAVVSDTQLVGALAPLLDLTVPREQGVKLDVDLDRLRTALKCTPTTPTTTAPPTTTTAPPVVFFPNCAAVTAAGASPLLAGDPGYRPALDADGDGIACELNETPTTTTPNAGGFSQVGAVPTGAAETGDDWALQQ